MHALPQADPEEPAVAERELRLVELVPRGPDLVARIQERREPLHAVRLGRDHHRRQRSGRDPQARERPRCGAAGDQHGRGRETDGDGRSEVRDHDQAAQDRGGRPTGRIASRQSRGACPAGREHGRGEHAQRDLGELGRLQREAAGQTQPALRAVALDACGEHEEQQARRDHEHAGRERGDVPVVAAGEHPERNEAEAGVDRVMLEQRERGRGRVDHDDAEGHERHGDDHEQLLGAARLFAAAAHASASTSSRKRSPRASKSRNWS